MLLSFDQGIISLIDVMGNTGLDLAAQRDVVNIPSRGIAQMIEGIRNFKELLFSTLIARIGSWMILQSELFISLFDVVQRSSSPHSQNLIVALLLLRVMLLEKALFLLAENSLVLIEPIKHLEGVINGVVGAGHHIVLVPSGRI